METSTNGCPREEAWVGKCKWCPFSPCTYDKTKKYKSKELKDWTFSELKTLVEFAEQAGFMSMTYSELKKCFSW